MSCLLLCCIRMLLYVVCMLLAETSQVLFLLFDFACKFYYIFIRAGQMSPPAGPVPCSPNDDGWWGRPDNVIYELS
jgi:hypothetical protein